MADKTIAHYAIKPRLFNDIVSVLEQVPGSTVRRIMNRIENLNSQDECTPVFLGGNLGGHKVPGPVETVPKPKRKAKKKAKRKVAKKRGGQ